jgi:hypothetical protein
LDEHASPDPPALLGSARACSIVGATLMYAPKDYFNAFSYG